MNLAYLSLGSNMGNRHQNLLEAQSHIENYAGKIKQRSSVYETAPWGNEKQPSFLNQVIIIETNLAPASLLHELLAVERLMGRNRSNDEKWGARNIDIDILLYDDVIISTDTVTIPHPHLHKRMFVLAPLNELVPNLIHPQLNKTIKQLKHDCSDVLEVGKLPNK